MNLHLPLQPRHRVSASWGSQEVQTGSAAVTSMGEHRCTAPNDVSQTGEIQKTLSLLCVMQTGLRGSILPAGRAPGNDSAEEGGGQKWAFSSVE